MLREFCITQHNWTLRYSGRKYARQASHLPPPLVARRITDIEFGPRHACLSAWHAKRLLRLMDAEMPYGTVREQFVTRFVWTIAGLGLLVMGLGIGVGAGGLCFLGGGLLAAGTLWYAAARGGTSGSGTHRDAQVWQRYLACAGRVGVT